MDIGRLEEILRTAIRRNTGQPAIALLSGAGVDGGHLPVEFDAAVKTLASRRPSAGKSILRSVRADWA